MASLSDHSPLLSSQSGGRPQKKEANAVVASVLEVVKFSRS